MDIHDDMLAEPKKVHVMDVGWSGVGFGNGSVYDMLIHVCIHPKRYRYICMSF